MIETSSGALDAVQTAADTDRRTAEPAQTPHEPAPAVRASLYATLGMIWKVLTPGLRKRLAACLALMCVGAAAELVTIGAVLPFLALLVDPAQALKLPGIELVMRVTNSGPDASLAVWVAALLSLAAIASAVARLLIARQSQSVVLAIGHWLACLLFSRALNQPYENYLRRNPSEILAGLEKAQLVTGGLLSPLMHAAAGAVIASSVALVLFVLEPLLVSAVCASAACTYFVIAWSARGQLEANSKRMASAASARFRLLQEATGSIRDIQLGRMQPLFVERYRRNDARYREAQLNVQLAGQAPRFLLEAAGIVLLSLFALYLAGRPGGLLAALPTLGLVAVAAQRLMPLGQHIYSGWSQAKGNLQAARDALALLAEPVLTATPLSHPVKPFEHAIRFEHVGFAYSEDRPALRDVCMTITKGARIGLTGPSGSGKSTLLDLLTGLLRPASGAITIDGAPLDESNLANWQAQIALVAQEVYLPDQSLATIVAFDGTDRSPDMARVETACRRAAIHEFIVSLPHGYQTLAGERGVALSGGQRQRIAIARAFFRNATLIILDEATSALDPATEAGVLAELSALDADVTMILVSHRASSFGHCDMIVSLADGCVAHCQTSRSPQ